MKTIEFMNGAIFEHEYVLRLLDSSEQYARFEKMSARELVEVIRPMITERKKGYEISLDHVFDKLEDCN